MATEPIKKRPAVYVQISSLRPDTSGHNLKLKVIDSKLVVNRPPGRTVGNAPNRIAECTVGDSTGSVVLTARNEQVDIAQPGKCIVVRNAKIDMFRGSMRLAVNHWGKIEPATEDLSFEPNVQNNLSLIEYELVPVPSAPPQAAQATQQIEKGASENNLPAAAAATVM